MEELLKQLLEGQKQILERLEKVEQGQIARIESEVKKIRTDLLTIEKVTAQNWRDIIELRHSKDSNEPNESFDRLERLMDQMSRDVLYLFRKITYHDDDIREIRSIKQG